MCAQASSRRRLGPLAAATLLLIGCAGLCMSEVRGGVPRSEGLSAWTAFSDCAAPEQPSRRRFYLDPARAGPGGDGSLQNPWPGLADALREHGGSLRAGDSLLLLSGDHGEVRLAADNPGWIRILPAPGARPVLRRARITGGRWLLSGLTFRDDHPGPMVLIDQGAHDILVENSRFLSADDAQGWSPQELNDRGAGGLAADGRRGTRCLTIRDNSFRFVDYAVRIMADKTVLAGNLIDNFGADAVDYHGSDLIIAHNVITNAREAANDEHIDAIQGFQPGGEGWDPKHNARVTIEGNLVIRQTDPNLPYPEYMQGIDAFDGDWDDLKVINNVVITNAYHGIFFASVHRGLIANNTVLSDGASTVNHPPHANGPAKADGHLVWISVGDRTHQGQPSDHVVLRNNIAQSFHLVVTGGEVEADHNLVYHNWFQGRPGEPRPLSVSVDDDLGDHNRVDTGLTRHFVAFDPKAFRYDLHLDAKSRAVGSGNRDLAPAVDIEGRVRNGGVDVGAYGGDERPVNGGESP